MPTIFKTSRNQLTASVKSLDVVVAAIREQKYAKEVASFHDMRSLVSCSRNADGTLDVDATWEKALPRIAFACDMQKQGGALKRTAYNGLVLLEINNLQNEDMAIGLRYFASQLPQTLLTFVGADALSVVIVCRAELIEGSREQGQPLPTAEDAVLRFHQNAYAKAQKFYSAQLGATVDVLEPRLDRVCYMSADAALCYNPKAIPVYADTEESFQFTSPYQHPVTEPGTLPGRDHYKTQMIAVQTCLAKAFDESVDIDDEQEWLTSVLTRHAHYCMESGVPKELALRLTLFRPRLSRDPLMANLIFENAYSPKAVRKALKNNPATAALRHIPKSTLLMLKTNAFMEQNYEFRKNMLTGAVQFRSVAIPYFDFVDVTDADRNTMTRRALEAGLESWDKDIKRYIESNDVPLYNPIDDYLSRLPSWDGTDRLAAFARRVPTADTLWTRFFPLWMRSMVAHWLGKDQNHGNALVPLLIGPQGCGKSTFCGIILPPELQPYYNDRINFRNEFDLLNQLSAFALINIDEFDSVGRTHQAVLKYLLSTPNAKLRIPYGKTISQRRRYASFVATTNHLQPLTDPTGSRRFLCVSINGSIDTTSPVNYDQLYAQLLAEIKDGQRYWLNDEETAELIAHNEPFRQIDSISEIIDSLYRRPESGVTNVERVSVADIARTIHSQYPGIPINHATMVRIGKAMVQKGFHMRRSNIGNYYEVCTLKSD